MLKQGLAHTMPNERSQTDQFMGYEYEKLGVHIKYEE